MYKLNKEILYLRTDELLNNVNQLVVLEYFLRERVVLNVNVKSPIRSDPHPGCRYTIDKEQNLVLFDYSLGTSYNIIGLISKKLGITYKEAKVLIIETFIYPKHSSPKVEYKKIPEYKEREFKISFQPRTATKAELDLWSIGGLKITEEDFVKYGILPTSLYKINETLINCESAFILKNKDFTQVYRPDLAKDAPGLFGRYRSNTMTGIFDFDNKIHDDYSITTKSFGDAFYLDKLGFNTKFTLKESNIFTEKEYTKYNKNAMNILLYDNDVPGIRGANKFSNFFDLSFYPVENGIKDTKDYLRFYGKEKTKEFLKNMIDDRFRKSI